MKKQQGFASIVALLIVAAALTIGIQQWSAHQSQQRVLANRDSFYQRVLFLRTQFHAFANDKYLAGMGINTPHIFPFKLSDLEGAYIPVCSEEDNKKGYCFKYNQTPWGEISDKDYVVIPVPNAIAPTHYRAELTLALPDKNNEALKYEREATLQLFAQLPNILYDEQKNQLVLRIDRPDKAFAYESLVKRSGDDSTLLGDWDVGGNHAITNVKDITIKNSDNTQTIVSDGLVHVFLVKHNDTIDRPACPEGKESIINLMIGEIITPKHHTTTGRIRAYLKSTTQTQWRVGLDNIVKNDSNGKPIVDHSGYLTAITQCKTL